MRSSRILASLILASMLIIPFTAKAWTAGGLVKGSGPGVYYVTTSGKKLAFPDEYVYFSWYPDFSNIQKISDTALAKMPLAGYATMRPGAALVKAATSAQVFVIARGQTLRWVKSELIAQTLYGDDWNQKIIILPLAEIQNYRVGEDLTVANQFSIQTEQAASPNLNSELKLRALAGVTR